MPIKLFTTTLALCCAISLTAQADKVKLKARVSAEREVADDLVPRSVVLTNNGRTVLVLRKRDPGLDEKAAGKATPRMDLYDLSKITLIRSLDANERYGKQQVDLEEVVLYQDEPVLFGTIRDMAKGDLKIVYSKVDPNLTRAGRPYEEVVAFNAGIQGTHVVMGRPPGRRGPLFTTSPDTQTLLIVSPEVRDTVAGTGVFLITALGKEFSEKWKHVVAVEEGLDQAELLDAKMDANGNAWMMVRYDYKGRKAAKGEIESEVKLFHVSEDGIRGIRFGLDRNQYLKSARLKVAADGSLVCAGMASSTAVVKDPGMLYIADLPKSPNDITAPRLTKDPFASAGKNMEMRNVLRSGNGDTYLVIEEYEYASIPHPKTLKQSMKHVHGNVHVMKVNSAGAPQWNTSIIRLVHAESEYFGNVHAALFENELSLFMLDSDKLVERRSTDGKGISPADLAKPYTVHFMFDEKGQPRTKKIIDSGYTPTLIAGRKLYPIGKDRFLTFGSSKFEGGGYLPVDLEFSK